MPAPAQPPCGLLSRRSGTLRCGAVKSPLLRAENSLHLLLVRARGNLLATPILDMKSNPARSFGTLASAAGHYVQHFTTVCNPPWAAGRTAARL